MMGHDEDLMLLVYCLYVCLILRSFFLAADFANKDEYIVRATVIYSLLPDISYTD